MQRTSPSVLHETKSTHNEKNQKNYEKDAATHNKLGLNSTLYLAYRDLPILLRRHLPKQTSYRILDFGCGAGLSTELITKIIADVGHKAEICGIDISEQNIKFARQRLPQTEFVKINPGESLSHLGKFDIEIQ